MPVPYVRLRPGPVFNALGEVGGEPVVTIDGAETFDTDGSLDVTTVYEDGGPGGSLTLLQAVRGWLDPTMTVIPRDLLYAPEAFDNKNAAEERQQEGVVQMRGSEQAAVVAALRFVDEPVKAVVSIDSVLPDSPSVDVLEAGDVIVSVDGVPIRKAQDVRAVVSKLEPGDTVTFKIERDGERQTVEIKTVPSTDDPDRPMVGIIPTISYDSPVDVSISLADVGGPSAGLMFALSTVDKLTPDSLTDGRTIAGTGTINVRGRVGAIGGIAQKMAGAREDGAEVFLAPSANCTEVVGHIPDGLQVLRVDSLSGAVRTLNKVERGSENLPTCAA
jgi:Lon-like protease